MARILKWLIGLAALGLGGLLVAGAIWMEPWLQQLQAVKAFKAPIAARLFQLKIALLDGQRYNLAIPLHSMKP